MSKMCIILQIEKQIFPEPYDKYFKGEQSLLTLFRAFLFDLKALRLSCV